MTCHDVQQHLYDFLDSALDSATGDAVQHHLETCTPCRTAFEATQSIEDQLRHTLREEPVPPTLWPRIQADLDRVVPAAIAATTQKRRRPWLWSAALAAVLVLSLGIALLKPVLMRSESLHARLLSVPVNDLHTFVVSQRPLDMASADPQQLRQWFQQKVAFPPPVLPVQVGAAYLVGGRLCYFLERRVASYMYSADGHYVSLYVMPHEGLQQPSDAVRRLRQPQATVHEVQGYTHVIWSHTGLLYSLVSDLPQGQIFAMARQMMRAS